MNEATGYTGLCSRTLRRAIADGSLRAYRAGRVWRFKKHDLDAMFTPADSWEVA
ncbi:excisionase family DNA-binding protein [Corynebacterium sp. ACRPX]|uniref:excisionase family DNA-binding protein n=1 Tax=Corynebacterium sp. ACRPX TaxID=2918185 RepID=UPI001EF5572C|nr:excisionase family DNA-binding protein [Corynebacterium sp. ACRPX]MCG7245617.1 excisionase family DNA-binding protein [Corynebacterium sp. ACRPX]